MDFGLGYDVTSFLATAYLSSLLYGRGRLICQIPRIELLTQVLRRKLSVGDLYALGGRGSGNNEMKKKLF